MTECGEHHWGSNGRCKICSMQARYYYEGMATLNKWTTKEKADEAEHYQSLIDGMKCKPHTHTVETVRSLNDPLMKLYDMEVGQ
jgi:hypothetical protein